MSPQLHHYAVPTNTGWIARCVLILTLLVATLGHTAAKAAGPSAQAPASDARTGRVVVRFKPGAPALKTVEASNARVVDRLDKFGVRVLQPSAEGAEALLARLRQDPDVLYAEPERLYRLFVTPNDDYFPSQWGHKKIRSESAWNISKGSTAVKVAIIDTGTDYNHPDLKDRYAGGYDFADEDGDPMDIAGHGTHVAGIAAATGNNGIGVAGVGWYTKILVAKVFKEYPDGSLGASDPDISEGIIWATDNGAAVINLSLGGYSNSSVLADAVKYAQSKGVLVVAAAGNENLDLPSYPAALPGVIGVAASAQDDTRATFSNYGDYIDIIAPGVGIVSTWPDSDYVYLNGTSMASPFVAGAAAVIKAKYPAYTGAKLWERLRVGADDLGARGRDDYFGHGRLNLLRALSVPGRVSGAVKNAKTGAALPNVKVSLDGTTRYVLTDSSGKYRLGNIPAGRRALTFTRSGFETHRTSFAMPYDGNVLVSPGLKPLATLTGYVRNSAGRPISGATVRVEGTTLATKTGATGLYSISNVPLRALTVKATKQYYLRRLRSVTTTMGETRGLNFVLVKRGTVTGKITDKVSGKALSDVVVAVSGTALKARTDSVGVYRIQGVPAGARTLTASKSGYTTGSRTISVANNTVTHLDYALERSNAQTRGGS